MGLGKAVPEGKLPTPSRAHRPDTLPSQPPTAPHHSLTSARGQGPEARLWGDSQQFYPFFLPRASQVVQAGKNPPVNAGEEVKDAGLIPGLGR